jgi:hypothetical protein
MGQDYDLGDVATLTIRIYDPTTSALTDATVAITITLPDGTTATPVVSHPDTGSYLASQACSQTGVFFYTWTISGSITASESGQFTVANPKPLLYASLDDIKGWLRIPTSDTVDDDRLLSRLASASRGVDKDTGRPRGYGRDRVASSRIYRPHHEELLSVDDIATATGLVVEIGRDNTWSGIDGSLWDTLPENASADERAIETLRRLVGTWPMWGMQRIRVTAVWGWPSVPAGIQEATVLRASRLFRRRDTPEGIKGFGDLGVMRLSRYDSDYDNLIDPFKKDAP